MKKYTIIAVIAMLIIAGCEKDENDKHEKQRKVVFTAKPVNGKIAFETIDDPKNVIKDEAWLNTTEPNQADTGFIEKDQRPLAKKRKSYKVVGVRQ